MKGRKSSAAAIKTSAIGVPIGICMGLSPKNDSKTSETPAPCVTLLKPLCSLF